MHGRARGQILPLFALSLVAMLALAALLFDGATALQARRQLQNAGDAAALAGANVLQGAGTLHACSAVIGPPPGAPRQDIVDAVLASIDANAAGLSHADVSVTCPTGYDNQAVRVELRKTSSMFFGGAVGPAINVATKSTALNGQITGSLYSVVELNPHQASWHQSRRGCPSVLLSGGPTVIFQGSLQINSACPAADGGAFSTNGTAASVTLVNNAKIRMVGGYAAGPLTITPAPLTGQPAILDPLSALEAVPVASLTERSSSKLTLSNTTQVLEPGIYRGGIELRNSSVALLRPGIFVLDGGGLSVGAQASLCSIDATTTATNCSSWDTKCPDTACGTLIYNTGTASGSGALGAISVAAGATLKLRAYDERATANAYPEYRNILLWQSASPVPTSTYGQPTVQLSGGGSVDISGSVYAPSAKVVMGGNSGGSGGSSVNLTLQFISWDLELSGNSSFTFYYQENEFARPLDYGLVE